MNSLIVFYLCLLVLVSESYDTYDPSSNITIKWDVIAWMPDGYMATVTINNFQQYRPIGEPGWQLGWTWAKKEVIWDMWGAEATRQGDCSQFKDTRPHCCETSPLIADLTPSAPYNQQSSNCCRGGVLSPWALDPTNSISSFQLSIGQSGTSNKTIRVPKNYILKAPGARYTCGQGKIIQPSQFTRQDGRRTTQALMTWSVTCVHSQTGFERTPRCCVSLSSFYSKHITPCTSCACGCRQENLGRCVVGGSNGQSAIPSSEMVNSISVLCTDHMCPIRVHWHIKVSYKGYWSAKVTISNLKYGLNLSEWTLVVQHPNFNHITQVYDFEYKPLVPDSTNDTGMFYGQNNKSGMLMEAGHLGYVQSEVLMEKEKNVFTFRHGWAFPRRIYFNGDQCVLPPFDKYPRLPNCAVKPLASPLLFILFLVML